MHRGARSAVTAFTTRKDLIFRLRNFGRDHTSHDTDCPGCEPIGDQQYPRMHKHFGTTCLGLVHAERLADGTDEGTTVLVCDVCYGNPKMMG